MQAMVEAARDIEIRAHDYAMLRSENEALRQELEALKQQLAWLKRQLFGPKSEKRLIDEKGQSGLLFEAVPESEEPAPTEQINYTRQKGGKDRGDAVTDSGLRFTEDVPVEVIHVNDPEAETIPETHRELIDEKVTHRLAQRPGSYVVLEYRRAVVKDRRNDRIHTTQARANVLDNSLADVSFLAGMLIDKFCYHLPLYRQHQRLAMSGITISPSTLTNLVERAVALLKPVYDAQLEHILQSKVLAMDETPIKAGRSRPGKMKQTWFWPVYGQGDEVCFIHSPSRGSQVVVDALGEHFDGTLVTDGHSAYTCYVDKRPDVIHANCWAHARRKFEAALKAEPKAAEQGLELIGQLYQAENRSETRTCWASRNWTGEPGTACRSSRTSGPGAISSANAWIWPGPVHCSRPWAMRWAAKRRWRCSWATPTSQSTPTTWNGRFVPSRWGERTGCSAGRRWVPGTSASSRACW